MTKLTSLLTSLLLITVMTYTASTQDINQSRCRVERDCIQE